MKLTHRSAAVALAIVAALALTTPAQATPSSRAPITALSAGPSAGDLAWAAATFAKFAVPQAKRAGLLKKMKSGQPWDANRRGARPKKTETKVIGGTKYTIDRYADGSIRAIGSQVPRVGAVKGSSTDAVHYCTVQNGSGFANYQYCQIDGIWGTVQLGTANVSFTLLAGRNNDRITATGVAGMSCKYPTSCTSPTIVSQKLIENSAGAAWVRWQSDITAPWGSWNIWYKLNVGGNSYWKTTS